MSVPHRSAGLRDTVGSFVVAAAVLVGTLGGGAIQAAAAPVAVVPAAAVAPAAATPLTADGSSTKKSDEKKSAKKKSSKKSKKKSAAAKKAAAKKKAKKARRAAWKESATLPELRSGSRGKSVSKLQRLLRKNGYWLSSVDGTYGPTTQQAVMALQKASGRDRNGRVSRSTWYELLLGTKPTSDVKKSDKTVFEIDLSRQIMMRVKNGKVLQTFNVSSGSNQRYYSEGRYHVAWTPTGTFTVYFRRDKLHIGTLGAMYRPQYFRSGGWAIHGSPSIPAYPASHGCIRVSNAAMDHLWGKGGLGIGSTVTIHK